VNGIDVNVGSLKRPFQQTPEILKIIGVHIAAHEFNRMVNDLVRIDLRKLEIGFESVRVDMGTRLNSGADFGSQCSAACIGNMCCFNAARSLLVRSLENPENCFLAGTSSPFDLPIADVTVHILGETANEGFIGFNPTAHLEKGARLHCQPDTMIHEPSGFC